MIYINTDSLLLPPHSLTPPHPSIIEASPPCVHDYSIDARFLLMFLLSSKGPPYFNQGINI